MVTSEALAPCSKGRDYNQTPSFRSERKRAGYPANLLIKALCQPLYPSAAIVATQK